MKIKAKDSSNESSDVRRARAKLKKHLSSDDKKITAKALQKATKSIEQWISRHEGDRVSLTEKDVKIFDANKHPAEVSKYIKTVMLQISQGARSTPQSNPLHGRVTG